MKKLDKLIIIGSRPDGHAGVVLDFINELKLYEVIGFLDDNKNLAGTNVLGIPVLGTLDNYLENPLNESYNFFICIGDNVSRQKIHKKLVDSRCALINIIHPSSYISKSVFMGSGVFIGANVNIMYNSIIGNCVIINNAASIDHDNIIDNYVNISPGCHTSGRVTIKNAAFLGTGAIVIPDIIINDNAIVGAGSVVIHDVPANTKVVGNPAKKMNI